MLRIIIIYFLLLLMPFIILKHDALIYLTTFDYTVFLFSLILTSLFLFLRKKYDEDWINNQFKYLTHTFWVGIVILIIAFISLFFIPPILLLFCLFIIFRVVIGLVYLFQKRKLKW